MSETSYDVRIWKISPRKNTSGKVTSYSVRWGVGGRGFYKSFQTRALADSFRSSLLQEARRGELFSVKTGMPSTFLRTAKEISWLSLIQDYSAMKWPNASASYRRCIVQSLTAITLVLVQKGEALPSEKVARVLGWELNPSCRRSKSDPQTKQVRDWIENNAPLVSSFKDPAFLRVLLDGISKNRNGDRAAPDTFRLRRVILQGVLEYAVELGLLETNPIESIKTRAPISSRAVDRRSVVNPKQAHELLKAVGQVQKSGPHLVAFFGLMYFAGLRPEEAAGLTEQNLSIPREGWGDLHLDSARPDIGAAWTDSGAPAEARGLKHRHSGVGRSVPCRPELSTLLRKHLAAFGTARDGRLFRGERDGGRVSSTVYGRVWAAAREIALSPAEAASPLAKRPYDLRHACLSTWLNAGVEPTRVAEWAGHSVRVLLDTYARCLHGGEEIARQRIEEAAKQMRWHD